MIRDEDTRNANTLQLLPHDHTPTEEDDMKARNMVFNIDGLGVAWYTSSSADFERGKTVC